MTRTFTETVVIPLASPKDAKRTADAVVPYLDPPPDHVLAITVVEKTEGGIDKAPLEQMTDRAEETLGIVAERFDEAGVPIETRVLYGENVIETILDAAREADASSIVMTPRNASRWVKLLSGDTALSLMMNTDRPLIVVPDPEGTD